MVQCWIKFILIYLKQIFLQNKPYQQILLKIKEYCGKWQNLSSFNSGKQKKEKLFLSFPALSFQVAGCFNSSIHFNLFSELILSLSFNDFPSRFSLISHCRSVFFRFGTFVWPESPLRALLRIGFTTYFKAEAETFAL